MNGVKESEWEARGQGRGQGRGEAAQEWGRNLKSSVRGKISRNSTVLIPFLINIRDISPPSSLPLILFPSLFR